MNWIRTLATPVLLAAGLVLITVVPAQAQTCQPGLVPAFQAHPASYAALINAIAPQIGNLGANLAAVQNQASYEVLLATARVVSGSLTNGRVLVTLPDGTVALDTNRADNTADPKSNSYQHFLDKTINENHNSRVAIFMAQEYPCGLGLERKLSSSTGQVETYFAVRLGAHLDSEGTARVSVRQ